MARVLFANPTLSYGGGEHVMFEQMKAIADLGITIDLVYWWRKGEEHLFKSINKSIQTLDKIYFFEKYSDEFKRNKYDLLIACNSPEIVKLMRIKTLLVVHEPYSYAMQKVNECYNYVHYFCLTYDFKQNFNYKKILK